MFPGVRCHSPTSLAAVYSKQPSNRTSAFAASCPRVNKPWSRRFGDMKEKKNFRLLDRLTDRWESESVRSKVNQSSNVFKKKETTAGKKIDGATRLR